MDLRKEKIKKKLMCIDSVEEKKSEIAKEFYSQFFFSKQLMKHPSLITGESTPSYFLHSDIVIPRIKLLNSTNATIAKNHFLVMLRDPVKRAFSHYQMVIDPHGTVAQKRARGTHWLHRSFENVMNEELNEFIKL
jgi:hypothetical protein